MTTRPGSSTRDAGSPERAGTTTNRPVELLLFLPFGAIWLLGLAFGLPANLPDAAGWHAVETHYFRPVGVAIVLQVLVLRLARRNRASIGRRHLTAMVLLTVASVFVHMNFKAWMPLVHHRLFDVELAGTDAWLGSFVSDLVFLRRTLSRVLFFSFGVDVDPLYHSLFVVMFFVSASAHAVFDTPNGFRRLVVAMCAVLLLGGVSYWLVPARGPFVFRPSSSYAAATAQEFMLHAFDELLRTHRVASGAFVAPLAAMPSLHTAHSVLFVWFAAERVPWLLWVYVPALLWILFEAIAASWHYVLDLPAGALLALLVIWAVRRVLPEPPPEPQPMSA